MLDTTLICCAKNKYNYICILYRHIFNNLQYVDTCQNTVNFKKYFITTLFV